jgi:Flp pilus assembly protein TadD
VDNRRDDAIETLQAAEDAGTATPDQLRKLTLAWQAMNLPENADRVLMSYEAADGAADAPLLRSQLLRQRGDLPGAIDTLEQSIADNAANKDSDAGRRVRVALALLQLSQNDLAAARETLLPCIEQPPIDVTATRLWATLALNTQSWEELERAEELLKAVEGEQGVDWRYFRARRLLALADATAAASDGLPEVERLAYEVESLRPHWLPGIELRARILEMQGQISAAVAAYRRVIEAEADPATKSMLAHGILEHLLSDRDADSTNNLQLARLVAESSALSLSAIGREVAAGNTAAAVEIGQEATRRNPSDPQLQMWFGYALQLVQRFDEAEAALRRATQLAPANETAWYALLGLVARSGQTAEVSALVRDFMQTASIPEPRRSIFVVRAAELIGDQVTAQRLVDHLAKDYPQNATALKEAGRWYASWDAARAQQLLQQAFQLRSDRDTARVLARVTAAHHGDDASFAAAKELLLGPGAENSLSGEDGSAYAEILARRGRVADRREAIDILQQQRSEGGANRLSLRDLKLLAELLERDGQLEAAGAVLAESIADAEVNAEQLRSYASYLLRQGVKAHADYLKRADETIARLQQANADDLNAVYLRIRWLQAAGESARIMPLVSSVLAERFPTMPEAARRAHLLVGIADTLKSVGLMSDAEKLYRQAAQIAPEARRPLMLYLSGKGDLRATSESLDMAYQMIAEGRILDGAVALGQVLLLARTDADQWNRGERVVVSTLEQNPDNINLLLTFSSMLCFQGRTQEAIPVLRKVLTQTPNSFQAKNNLAFALALEGDTVEAHTTISQAIGLAGLRPGLLDTRAIVRLAEGNASEAVKDLLEITRWEPKEPVYWLHLALAQLRVGDRAAAQNAWLKARAVGIGSGQLTQYDQQAATEIAAAL